MTTLTLTVDRSSLSLPDLLIGARADGTGLWISTGDADTAEPAWEYRYTYAPDSAVYPGKQLLAAVRDQSTLPVAFAAEASTPAGLAALKAEVATAFSQFAYLVTLTIDGQPQAWSADPCAPHWGPLTAAAQAQLIALGSVVIPVNPSEAP